VDRLFLTLASGFPEFRLLYDSLAGMGFYSISPEQLRDLQEPGEGSLLLRDGRNAASVMAWLTRQVGERIEEYLANIAPGTKHVGRKPLGHKETLEFKQAVACDEHPWSFLAQNMSDGTLRALGVLISLFQCFDRPRETPIPLVGIEEPESTLHPAAAGVLMGAMFEASHYTQVVATTHSPELMDTSELDADSLLIVDASEGETLIGPADEASKSVMRDRLYTAGELLKLNQLRPAPKAVATAANQSPLPLFPNE
jgi:predicted ATPase